MDERNSPASGSKDRISALPDSLIHHILSFIDMIYAVQSSVLSKRWRYIWTSLPTLNFDEEEEEYDDIVDFVNKVLLCRDSCLIQRFYLNVTSEVIDSTHIYSWITALVRRNVEEIEMNCSWKGDFEIPPCLSTCKSLTELDLSVLNSDRTPAKVILPTSVSLPRLKSMILNLQDLFFEDEHLTNKFFSCCPALESLCLENCRFSDMNLSISSLNLKHFTNTNYNNVGDMNLTLYAPNLTTLYCHSYKLKDYSLENLSSLVSARMFMPKDHIALLPEKEELYARRMMNLLRVLHNVTSLTLSAYFKVLSEAPEILDNQLPKFLNLRSLQLTTWLSRDCIQAIFFLLKISPNIESLGLNISTISSNESSLFPFCDEINAGSQEDYWDSGLMLPCVLHHLKSVTIQGLEGRINELKFIEVLLKNSMVLEKVVLFSIKNDTRVRTIITRRLTRKRVIEKVDPHAEGRMKKFNEILLTFPRASTCTITLDPSDETD